MTDFLEVKDLTMRFGGLTAVDSLSFKVAHGSIHGLIGPNGAGKTTTLRAMSGMLPITAGEITFEGKRIDHLPAHKVVANGIAHVPEGRRIFPDMTVEENLRTGAFLRKDTEAVEADLEDVFKRFPRLRERRTQMAKTMSGGEQQMLAIGRALMSKPRLLLMDEPLMGLAPVIVEEIARIVEEINANGLSVVLHFRRGALKQAEQQQARALRIWAGAAEQVEEMQIAPRSRSSLFHLRMEALHRETFHANLKTRVGLIAVETGETLRNLTSGRAALHRHASRWRGEKPTVFDGTRKVLGACLLLLDT